MESAKVKKTKARKTSHRANGLGKIMTERNKCKRLFKYLNKHPNDEYALAAFERVGGNINKLTNTPIPPVEPKVLKLEPSVRYSKRMMGEAFKYVLVKKAKHLRDFHATYMSVEQLKAGITRARKRMRLAEANADEGWIDRFVMYEQQVEAYQARLLYYEKG